MMNCEEVEYRLYDYNEGTLDVNSIKVIEKHIQECTSCASKLKKEIYLNETFSKLKEYKPSERLRSNFYSSLYNKETKQKNRYKLIKSIFGIAASILILIMGFYLGKYSHDKSIKKQISEMAIKNKVYKKEMLLALIENNSVSKRIQGINEFESFGDLDSDVIESLLSRIKFDTNVNVKLMALDALHKNIDSEFIRDELLMIIEITNALKVKLEIIKLLMNDNEKRLLNPMKQILKTEDLPQAIEEQLKLNISTLI